MTYAKLAKERDELKQEIERLNYEYDKAFERLKIQQQEIDRLRENERLKTKFVKDREAKAVKEFAEKLKIKCHNYYPSIDHYCCSEKAVNVKDIDELLKEYEVEE